MLEGAPACDGRGAPACTQDAYPAALRGRAAAEALAAARPQQYVGLPRASAALGWRTPDENRRLLGYAV